MAISPLQIVGVEWIWVILVVAVLLFGSKKLPEVARALGKAMGEFQKGRTEMEKELKQAYEAPLKGQSPAPSAYPIPTRNPISSSPPVSTEREKLEKIARELAIPTQGKTDDDLRAEIQRALTKS